MSPLERAFACQIPHAEKLVLVYLASQASAAGVGRLNRGALERATGYKKRSTQRLLKSLRDAKLLENEGDWYIVCPGELGGEVPSAVDMPNRIMTIDEVAADESERSSADDGIPAAADVVAERMIDAAQYLLDQLDNFESRLSSELARFVSAAFRLTEAAESFEAPAPPDPIANDPRYSQLIDMGLDPAKARETVQALLNDELDENRKPDPIVERNASNGEQYPDSPSGRLLRILDILDGQMTDQLLARWSIIEGDENRHTVKGEAPAFELLYPAIVEAARRNAGKMTIEEFLDADKIKACRAPWDEDPEPTAMEDPTLEAEISTMLAEIEAAAHPNCQVQPRVRERGDDGVERTETIIGYHRRVSQVYRQLKRMQAMGAA